MIPQSFPLKQGDSLDPPLAESIRDELSLDAGGVNRIVSCCGTSLRYCDQGCCTMLRAHGVFICVYAMTYSNRFRTSSCPGSGILCPRRVPLLWTSGMEKSIYRCET